MKLKPILLSVLVSSSVWSQNILPNPSFEQWFDTLSVQMPIGWVTSNFIKDGSAAKDSTKHTGTYGVKLYNDSSIAFIGTVARVESGRNYIFSGWVKCPSLIGGGFVMSWRDSLGYGVGDSILIPVFISFNYTNYKDTLLAPDSAAFIAVGFTTIPTVTVYLDDITLDSMPRAIEENANIKNQNGKLEILNNPLLNKTVIHYSIPMNSKLRLVIYDIYGRTVKNLVPASPTGRDEEKPAGNYVVNFSTKGLPPGIYFAKLSINNSNCVTRKLILLK